MPEFWAYSFINTLREGPVMKAWAANVVFRRKNESRKNPLLRSAKRDSDRRNTMSEAERRRVDCTGRGCRRWPMGRPHSGGKERCKSVPSDHSRVTNKDFCGAYAEYAVASAQMVAAKPRSLSFVEAASIPVVAVTAYQMLFDYAQLKAGQSVLIHGAAGNVGAYAVQLAKQAEVQVFATAGPADVEYVRSLGAETVVNYKTTQFEDAVPPVDAVLDTVGGETQHRSFRVLKPGGILVSVISPPPQPAGFRAAFFLVDVTATRLGTLARLLDSRKLTAEVGSVLPLEEARMAHEMLAGAPHKRGKIVLTTQGVR